MIQNKNLKDNYIVQDQYSILIQKDRQHMKNNKNNLFKHNGIQQQVTKKPMGLINFGDLFIIRKFYYETVCVEP